LDTNRIRIVLVNTTQPGNIGGAARAMMNMGLSRLYLVQPDVFPSDRAVWRAAGAKKLLDSVVVVDKFEDAIDDCHFVVGTSARERRIPWPLVDPRQCADQVLQEVSVDREVALVFGREHSGLTNDELQMCHAHVHIPSNPEYSSLNLCAAVQVITYEIRMAMLAADGELPLTEAWDEPLAKSQDVDRMVEHLEQTMTLTGFHDPDNPRQTMTRLRRLFNRVRLDTSETAILRGFLASIDKVISR
jgi:tRNA (cytidine32/uridine32-2'-O)-methyltransferase